MVTATNALTYNGYVTQLGLMGIIDVTTTGGVVVGTDAYFGTLIPQALNYAELRIQRDLNLLPAQQTNTTYSVSSGANTVLVSVDDFVTIRTVSANINGQMTALLPTSVEWLQNVYPSTAIQGPPAYFAMLGGDAGGGNVSNIIQVGPPSDNAYPLSIVGTVRLPSLNKYNTAPQASTLYTFISTYLPDLLLMSSLLYLASYQRDFGKTSDEPNMAGSYEYQYQVLLKSAMVEEARKQFSASAWSSMPPPVVSTPSR